MTGHKKEPPRTRGGSFLLIPWACPRGRTPCRRRRGAGARRRSGGWVHRMPVHSYGFQPQQTEDGGRVVNEPPAVDYPAGYSIGPGNDEG